MIVTSGESSLSLRFMMILIGVMSELPGYQVIFFPRPIQHTLAILCCLIGLFLETFAIKFSKVIYILFLILMLSSANWLRYRMQGHWVCLFLLGYTCLNLHRYCKQIQFEKQNKQEMKLA